MRIKNLFLFVYAFALLHVGFSQVHRVHPALPELSPSPKSLRPDATLTPGVVCPGITAEDLVAGYASKVRAHGTPDGEKITDAVKAKVYAEYHILEHKPGEYEIDHLISLELGGSHNIRNLWPQSYTGNWNAHHKDKLENEVHRRVVAGTMKLADAQRMIAHDWIALYRLTFPQDLDEHGLPRVVGKQTNMEPDL